MFVHSRDPSLPLHRPQLLIPQTLRSLLYPSSDFLYRCSYPFHLLPLPLPLPYLLLNQPILLIPNLPQQPRSLMDLLPPHQRQLTQIDSDQVICTVGPALLQILEGVEDVVSGERDEFVVVFEVGVHLLEKKNFLSGLDSLGFQARLQI